MAILTKKLLRNVQASKGQFVAVVAVVALGVLVNVAMNTAYSNLKRSQEDFYTSCRFADHYFHVVAAPESVVKKIGSIKGVAGVTGRIMLDVPWLKQGENRATARVVTYDPQGHNEVNRLRLLTGRMFKEHSVQGRIEVLVDPQFAEANRLQQGSVMTLLARGRRVELVVVGTATGPEFIYPMKDAASWMPEPEKFGIVMMPQRLAQNALGYPQGINQVVVVFEKASNREAVIKEIRQILKPYGNLSDYSRERQLSHAVLKGELDGLRTSATFVPGLFLGIAAVIQFMILSRLIRAQRVQIGVMKAMGCSNWEVIWHYTGYALLVAGCGLVFGLALGLVAAQGLSAIYAMYFNLPEAIKGYNGQVVMTSLVLTLVVSLSSGVMASLSVTKVQPAQAMRPDPPRRGSRSFAEKMILGSRNLNTAWKMVLRGISRNRGRFLITVLGVMLATGMLIIGFFVSDALDYILERHFSVEQRYDYMIRFTRPLRSSELVNIARLSGVVRVEPVLEIPVRLEKGGKSKEEVVVGLEPGTILRVILNRQNEPLAIPKDGILVSQAVAERLGVESGDKITVITLMPWGPSRKSEMTVMGINQQLIGTASYVSLYQANRLVGETNAVSGAMLKVDRGKRKELERQLGRMLEVSSITSREQELEGFRKNLDSLVFSVAVIVFFAFILGFAIVYNTSLIGLTERRRELVSLKVMGMTTRELNGLLWRELFLLAFFGLVVGLPFGRLLAEAYLEAVSTELFSLSLVIYPKTYVFSGLIACGFMGLAHFLALRSLNRVELAEALKYYD